MRSIEEKATEATPAQARADEWNARHPVGTLVRVWRGAREGEGYRSVVRNPARIMAGSHALFAWVSGIAGAVNVSHIEAVTEEQWRRIPPPPPCRPHGDSAFGTHEGVREVRWDIGLGCYWAVEDDTDAEPESEHLYLYIKPRGLTVRIIAGTDFPVSGSDTRHITPEELRRHIGQLQRLLFAIEDREAQGVTKEAQR